MKLPKINFYISAGIGIGIYGLFSTYIIGFNHPISIVLSPALIIYGIYKKIQH